MVSTYMRHLLPVILATTLVLGYAGSPEAQTPNKSALTVDDCVKCHAGPSADMAADGAAHQTIRCFACHPGHRPASRNNIPTCRQCHAGKPHYDMKQRCSDCHKNPHAPMRVTFGYNITGPCLTCHTTQVQQLKDNKSKHTNLFCSSCHNVHRVVPLCVQCHKPHRSDMTQADCGKCHKAHMPKVVTFTKDTPGKECTPCHQKAAALLGASRAKHKSLSCVSCHAGKHKTIPACQSCHNVPHAAAMLAKFPKCSECHYIAHDLNNWSGGAPQETRKQK